MRLALVALLLLGSGALARADDGQDTSSEAAAPAPRGKTTGHWQKKLVLDGRMRGWDRTRYQSGPAPDFTSGTDIPKIENHGQWLQPMHPALDSAFKKPAASATPASSPPGPDDPKSHHAGPGGSGGAAGAGASGGSGSSGGGNGSGTGGGNGGGTGGGTGGGNGGGDGGGSKTTGGGSSTTSCTEASQCFVKCCRNDVLIFPDCSLGSCRARQTKISCLLPQSDTPGDAVPDCGALPPDLLPGAQCAPEKCFAKCCRGGGLVYPDCSTGACRARQTKQSCAIPGAEVPGDQYPDCGSLPPDLVAATTCDPDQCFHKCCHNDGLVYPDCSTGSCTAKQTTHTCLLPGAETPGDTYPDCDASVTSLLPQSNLQSLFLSTVRAIQARTAPPPPAPPPPPPPPPSSGGSGAGPTGTLGAGTGSGGGGGGDTGPNGHGPGSRIKER